MVREGVKTFLGGDIEYADGAVVGGGKQVRLPNGAASSIASGAGGINFTGDAVVIDISGGGCFCSYIVKAGPASIASMSLESSDVFLLIQVIDTKVLLIRIKKTVFFWKQRT